MKHKLIFALLLVILIVSSCILPTIAAVPTGRSGVNFAQVPFGEVYVVYQLFRDGEEIGAYMWNATWNDRYGGFMIAFRSEIEFKAGDIVRLTVNVRPDFPLSGAGVYDNWLFEYMQEGQLYYADALLGFKGNEVIPLVDRHIKFYSHPTVTYEDTFEYECDGGHAFRVQPYNNNATIDQFEIEGTVQADVSVAQIVLYSFSILQDNPIIDITMGWLGDETTFDRTCYTPFNAAWFNITENEERAYQQGYNNGYQQGYAVKVQGEYNEGYQDGATEASGGAIQRWGAFLLTAVNGFLSFELIPGFPLWGLLSVAVAIPLLLMFLKMFAGG